MIDRHKGGVETRISNPTFREKWEGIKWDSDKDKEALEESKRAGGTSVQENPNRRKG